MSACIFCTAVSLAATSCLHFALATLYCTERPSGDWACAAAFARSACSAWIAVMKLPRFAAVIGVGCDHASWRAFLSASSAARRWACVSAGAAGCGIALLMAVCAIFFLIKPPNCACDAEGIASDAKAASATKVASVGRDILSSLVSSQDRNARFARFSRERGAALAGWLGELRLDASRAGDSLDTIPGRSYTQKTITAPAHPGRFSFMPGD